MRPKALLAILFVSALGLSLSLGAPAEEHHHDQNRHGEGAVRLLKTVPIPGTAANATNGNLYSWDISYVDQATQTYYLADRSNNAVDVVDAHTAAFVGQISANPPFAGVVSAAACAALGGTTCSGPNGVVAAFPWLFVTDGGSRVVNIDLRTGKIVPGGDVRTAASDPNRADELAYAPGLGLLLVIKQRRRCAVRHLHQRQSSNRSPHRWEEDHFHCCHKRCRTASVEPI